MYPFQIGDNFVALSPPGKENLEEDVKLLKAQNITAVVSLVSEEELKEKGLTNFLRCLLQTALRCTTRPSPISGF